MAWSLAIVGLIAIAAIPAYFLVYPIITDVRRGVASYLSRLVSRQSVARERRRRAVEALIEDFKENSGIIYLSERLTRVEAALGSFFEITKTLKPQLARVSDLERAFERVVASVEELREGVTSANAVAPRQLTTAEAHHFASLAGMWFNLTLLSLFLVTLSGLYAFFPYIGLRAASLVSVGLATCFLILGLLLPRGELLLDGTRNRRLIVSGALWKRKTVITVAVIVITAFGILLWRVGVTHYQAAFCILILVLCGVLSAAASQANATSKGLRIWVRLCVGVLFTVVEEVLRLIVRLFLAFIFCFEVVALALAAPAFLLRGREVPSLHAVDETKRPTFSVLRAS